ncbi:MAG TPA: hypothetical protein VFM79_12055 [Pelobium sp.]|nr:hypothetical protein [Pelobium sp.]
MKLIKICVLLLASVAIIATACNQQTNSSSYELSPSDSAKIAFYDKYFLESDGFIPNEKNKPVDAAIAEKCVDLYLSTKGRLNPKEIKKMLSTESVSFKMAELTPWLQDSLRNVKFDNMRVCLGVYDVPALENGNKPDSLAGKLTVYLWPYLGDEKAVKSTNGAQPIKIKPFNLGDLHP